MEALASDIDGFAAALDQCPDDLGLALGQVEAVGGPAQVSREAFLSAACDSNGHVIAADDGLDNVFDEPAPLFRAVEAAVAGARLSTVVAHGAERPMAIAVGPYASTRDWPLSAPVRQALEATGGYAILAVRSSDGLRWTEIARAFGFTGLEERVLADLVNSGALPITARRVGVSYETAREAVEHAMRKVGVRRQADLLRALTLAGAGELSGDDSGPRAFADMFDLTRRQARLAWAVAHGATRAAAARELGLSESAAKKDLKIVYQACGAAAASDLGRVVGEVDALGRLATATDIEILGPASRPLRLIPRRWSQGSIAVEDHGPPKALPVVIFHTLTNGRRLPGPLVAALQSAGLRPISVERPGFGLTTAASEANTRGVYADATADLVDVLDALRLTRVRLLGRGSVVAMEFAAAHPERVVHGLLVGPAPPDAAMRGRRGLLGAARELMFRRPHLVQGFARMVARGVNSGLIERLTNDVVRHCPADMAAMSDPVTRADYIRAVRQAAIAATGFLGELSVDANGRVPPGAEATRWTVLVGAHDPLQSNGDPRDLWAASILRPRVVVAEDGGRMLHLTHPVLIASLLAAE